MIRSGTELSQFLRNFLPTLALVNDDTTMFLIKTFGIWVIGYSVIII